MFDFDFKTWAKAAGIRALKTFAQTCVAMIPVGIAINEVSWYTVLGTGALAAVVSILTSIAGLPEVKAQESLELVRAGVLPLQDDRNEDKED